MPSIEESASAGTPLKSALGAGLADISYNQTITFEPYLRVVLPLDGFVFWVRAALLSPSAAYNTGVYNRFGYNQAQDATPLPPITIPGSMHVATELAQNVDETVANNTMIFSTQQPVRDLDDVHPNLMYIGEFEGNRFSFSRQGNFYQQSGVYHYRGDAVNGALRLQVIDDPALLDTRNVIVSNSLPIWLALNDIMPMYPAFLVPDNLRGAYAAIDVQSTEAIQAAPFIDRLGNQWQLVKDRVKITIYGLRNFNALDFVQYVSDYSLNSDNIGIMNMPVIRDEKRTMAELSIIAQKKSIDFEVNYYQTRVRDIGRQLILRSIPSYIIRDL